MKTDTATKIILVFKFVEEHIKLTKLLKVFLNFMVLYLNINFFVMPYACKKYKNAVINSELFVFVDIRKLIHTINLVLKFVINLKHGLVKRNYF